MKLFMLFITTLMLTNTLAQTKNISGAYVSNHQDTTTLFLVNDNYISITSFKKEIYLGTQGGPIDLDRNQLKITLEFNDKHPEEVGLVKILPFKQQQNDYIYIDNIKAIKVDKNKQNLDGLWRITARKSAERINEIPIGNRKTIKILVDGYFQWIAINPAEKGFYGTGGGLYTEQDGKYTEQIIFFSRDNSRVGNNLSFEATLKEGKWHHTGKSSKGEPIHEIWTLEHEIKKSSQ